MTFPNGTSISVDVFHSLYTGEVRDVQTSHLEVALKALEEQFANFEKWKKAKEKSEHYSNLKAQLAGLDQDLEDLDPLYDVKQISSIRGEIRGIESTMSKMKKEITSTLDEITPFSSQFKKVDYQFVDTYSSFVENLDAIPLSLYDKGEYSSFEDNESTNPIFVEVEDDPANVYAWGVRGNEEIDRDLFASNEEHNFRDLDGTSVASYSTVPFHDELSANVTLAGQESILAKEEDTGDIASVSGNASSEVQTQVVPYWFKKNVYSLDKQQYVDMGVASPVSSEEVSSVSSGDVLFINEDGKGARTSLVLNNSPLDKSLLVAEVGEKDKMLSFRKLRYDDVESSYVVKDMKKYCNRS